MNIVKIKKCEIETVEETVYFNIEYDGVEYNYLSLKFSDLGSIYLETPRFFCPCLGGMVNFYDIIDGEKVDLIKREVWDYAKNFKIIFDILRKKSKFEGTEFTLH